MENFDREAFKAQWVAALRSGNFQQGTQTLCTKDRYCCLGVAAHLLGVLEGGEARYVLDAKYGTQLYSVLPEEVIKKIGLSRLDHTRLETWNDSGRSFDEIANRLEKDWKPDGEVHLEGKF